MLVSPVLVRTREQQRAPTPGKSSQRAGPAPSIWVQERVQARAWRLETGVSPALRRTPWPEGKVPPPAQMIRKASGEHRRRRAHVQA